jgi:hypothetical protein
MPEDRRAISHGDQRSITATDENWNCQLSGPDGCTPYLPSWACGFDSRRPLVEMSASRQVFDTVRLIRLYSRTWQGRALGEDEYVIGAEKKTFIQHAAVATSAR